MVKKKLSEHFIHKETLIENLKTFDSPAALKKLGKTNYVGKLWIIN